ncbi:Molybdopterin oxidoreductase Fe4S4 domain-containing protein [Desulfobaculum bizertense DSM 18034]|uniref:Molybdopterin oxidoreductase Fe4S4 domain-containing protein n=2 Tax=Desulfobaculum TaxID=1433996 RepID=A0A1T4WYV2_9BACT|nr:Molybdopterin oxidoreductase Fe4S4 domain-containing protein [Desulfobaculum bizertense DSM 18034]
MKKVLTTCPYCGSGCTFYLLVEDGTIRGVEPNKENSVNNGSLCCKGHFGYDFVHHKSRLKTPLVRKNGKLVEASWEEAYAVIAKRLGAIKKDFGPDSIAGFSSARCSNEENFLMQKFMRAAIGTNNVDHCARL